MIRALSPRDVVALVVLMLASAAHALYFDHIADDAYISFRYAANFAAGNGLVFNPGEYVMGYSNFLWVLLLGAGEWLGVGAPLASRVLGIGLGWALILLVVAHLRDAFSSSTAAFSGSAAPGERLPPTRLSDQAWTTQASGSQLQRLFMKLPAAARSPRSSVCQRFQLHAIEKPCLQALL